MAQKSKINLKEVLLIVFVVVSVLLVGFQWGEALLGEEDNSPDFVRPTAVYEIDESLYQNWNQLDVTPTHQHRRTQYPEVTPTPNH